MLMVPMLLVLCMTLMSQYHAKSPRLRRVLTTTTRTASVVSSLDSRMPEVISQQQPQCTENAIVYFVEKKFDSHTHQPTYGNLIKSLDLLHDNYLQQQQQEEQREAKGNGQQRDSSSHSNTNLFLFHLGDFDAHDLQQIEWRYNSATSSKMMIQLVNLANTPYWEIPPSELRGHHDYYQRSSSRSNKTNINNNNKERHLKRWNTIKMWDYFHQLNQQQGCSYQYILRLDPDSFLYSPIRYNLFSFMNLHNYQYGYRLCSYNNNNSKHHHQQQQQKGSTALQTVWKDYVQSTHDHSVAAWDPSQNDENACIFYNHFSIGHLQFFLNRRVQSFLQFVDKGGYLYNDDSLSDADLQTLVVRAFGSQSGGDSMENGIPSQGDATNHAAIHRFLDFTFAHFASPAADDAGCPREGALQAGYNDPDAHQHISEWTYVYLHKRQCPIVTGNEHAAAGSTTTTRVHNLGPAQLSPTHSHLTAEIVQSLSLLTVSTGTVEPKHHYHHHHGKDLNQPLATAPM